jgi:diguanylate cyclase (GGDEF)-like protein/PAS domain S-box-containing protein
MSLSETRVNNRRSFTVIVRDITARKRLEEQLRKLSCAVEQSPMTVIITDTLGTIEYVNPKFVQLTGYTQEEAVGKNPRILKSDMMLPEEYRQLWETITAGGEWRGEFYNKNKHGAFYWEAASISAIRNSQGEITHFVAVKEDITAMKQTMNWLKESRERFRMLIESSRDGIIAYNKEFSYIIWNRAMEQISGIPGNAALGKNAFGLFPFLDRVGEGDCFRNAVEGKASVRLAMPYNVPQTERHGYFDSSHFPVFDANERVVGGMAIIRDATDRVRTERRMNAQYMVARALSDATALNDAFSGIIQVICEALGWDCGGVWLVSRRDEVLRCAEMWHVPIMEITQFKTITMEIPFSPGAGLPGRVWSSGSPAWIEDITKDVNFTRKHAAIKEELNSAFAFPLVSGKEVVGVIEFFSHQAQAPDNDLLDMLGATGKHIGQFIKRKQAEAQLQKLSHAVEQSSSSIVITDKNGIIEYVNPRFTQVTGYSADEVAGLTPRILKSGEHDPAVYKALWDDITSGKEWRGELCNRKKNGELYWEYASVAPVKDGSGNTTHFIAAKEDITRRRQFESQLLFLANHDPLTNLINRRCFHEKLDDHLGYAKRYDKHGALLFLDLDNFKFINDTLGHSEGDKLLVKLSTFLQKRLRDTDVLGRLGGDEFAIYLPNVNELQATTVAVQLLKQTREEVIPLSELYKNVTLSIGIAMYPDHGEAIATLLAAADLAMYQAKDNGKNCFCVYREEHSANIKNRLSWEERIHNALLHNSFALYLQPILDLKSNCISGYEAQLRMMDVDGKIVPPMDFLSFAEQSVIIHDIDRWVVRSAISLITEQKTFFADKHLEINLSGKSFTDEELLSFIKDALITSGIDPKKLVFEITETSVITNIREAQHFISTLETMGCHFALDDFGKGFSSFEYLKYLPVEFLKIDGSFIINLAHDLVDRQLVKAMVVMAHELGKQVTAEFVSDEKTLQLLKEYGVDYAQGYHVGVPKEWGKIVQEI